MTDTTHKLANPAVADYLLAGKGLVTLLNRETEGRHTYQITAPGETADERLGAQILWVSVLTGPENTADYTYIGIVVRKSGQFRLTKGSKLPKSDPRVAGFDWLCRNARRMDNYPHVEVRHHNHCGNCGRLLTVPQSVDTGLGKICAKRLGVKWLREDQKAA